MAIPADKLGTAFGPTVETIDGARARAYALATNEDNPRYASGEFVPPVFGVVPTWQPMVMAMEGIVPAEAQKLVVHGERDMHFHLPLVAGMTLTTRAFAYAWRVGSSGTRYTIKLTSTDAADRLVLDQYVTMFIQKMSDGEGAGPEKPDHTFPEAARSRKVGEHTVHIDRDQTFRYRDASGDTMRIHVDEEFAKRVGLPGIIVHGLCTMAMNSQSVIKMVAENNPARLRRLAVRWAKYVLPGSDLVTAIYAMDGAGSHKAYAFETMSDGAVVVAHGRAEISS